MLFRSGRGIIFRDEQDEYQAALPSRIRTISGPALCRLLGRHDRASAHSPLSVHGTAGKVPLGIINAYGPPPHRTDYPMNIHEAVTSKRQRQIIKRKTGRRNAAGRAATGSLQKRSLRKNASRGDLWRIAVSLFVHSRGQFPFEDRKSVV